MTKLRFSVLFSCSKNSTSGFRNPRIFVVPPSSPSHYWIVLHSKAQDNVLVIHHSFGKILPTFYLLEFTDVTSPSPNTKLPQPTPPWLAAHPLAIQPWIASTAPRPVATRWPRPLPPRYFPSCRGPRAAETAEAVGAPAVSWGTHWGTQLANGRFLEARRLVG